MLQDIVEDGYEHSPHFLETTEYSFMLPDISHYQEDFKAFLHKDLIETSTLVSLEQAGEYKRSQKMGDTKLQYSHQMYYLLLNNK